MIDVKEKAKVNIHWKVSPYDYSKEMENAIMAKASKKYGLPKGSVRVIPDLQTIDGEGKSVDVTSDSVKNIQDPSYQRILFKRYIEEKKIDEVDFKLIEQIDNEINSRIEYKVYDKCRRYSIKWIKWSNFLSYGEDNFFDFTKLGKLVLLNGEPANQSGKTTFAIDLMHFLFFGRITKYKTQDKFFNKHLVDATTMEVEGCIEIDGEEYVINRTLTRPSKSRRTSKSVTTQKVEYYRVVGKDLETLEDYVDNQQEEDSRKTNKVIKESLGTEDDFDLVVSVTDSNLDALIEKKDAERGRLLSRWIGLLPIEEKDAEARSKYNSEVKPHLLSNTYNTETLTQEIESFKITSKEINKGIKKAEKELVSTEKEIVSLEEKRNLLLSSKREVDESLMKVDISTLNREMETLKYDGINKADGLKQVKSELELIGKVDFSHEAYDKLSNEFAELKAKVEVLRHSYKEKVKLIEQYKTMEICPTCHRKLDNVDNSKVIGELTEEARKLIDDGKMTNEKLSSTQKAIESMKESREKYERRNRLKMSVPVYEANISKLREEYKAKMRVLSDYKANQEAIDKNNKLDIEARNTEALIKAKRDSKEVTTAFILSEKAKVETYAKDVQVREELIKKLAEEAKLIRHWKIYLDIVGKDGITKMVLREVIPIINGRLSAMLSDVCDFSVELYMTPKNEVMFYLCKDGVYSDLGGASGFEKTSAALALRSVLGEFSTIPKPNFFVADEILGRVAKENYDNMKSLMEKISKDYDFILNITHLDEFKDFCDTQVSVIKENNVSRLVLR